VLQHALGRHMAVMGSPLNQSMDKSDGIIDLAAFRRNEPQELSLADLLEQAEGLIKLQRAVLDECRRHAMHSEPDKRIEAVINSLQHLGRHISLLRQFPPER
jgi:hypothetical protein